MIAPRKAAVAGVAAAALALAGCHPPHENPSDLKVDTAMSQNPDSLMGAGQTTQSSTATNVTQANEARKTTTTAAVSAEGTPLLDNCDATGLLRPERLTVDCKNQDDFLEDIVWDEWGETLAVGTATRVVVSPDNREEGVQVVLGAPQVVDGKLVFTSMSVNGTNVTPENNY